MSYKSKISDTKYSIAKLLTNNTIFDTMKTWRKRGDIFERCQQNHR